MPGTSIITGILLILIGIAGYVYGMMGEHASITALIPAFFGVVMVILGAVAKAKDGLRKHLMHVAVAIALLGFILTAGRVLMKIADISFSAAVVSQVAMALVCLVYVLLSVRSFSEARRARN